MTTYLEQLNEYYNLKKNYENSIEKEKRNIINNEKLSSKEKRYEYEQIKHKCINCKRPVGSIFSLKYDTEKEGRILKAMCGDKVNPCPLNIVISLGEFDTYSANIKNIEDIIKTDKNTIIKEKNKLLFGYTQTEDALSTFETLKNNISEYTGFLSFELNAYMDIIENPEERAMLNNKIEEAYILIANIKDYMSRYNSSNDTQFVKDSVDIYVNSLTPKLNDILRLKYKYCKVELDDNNVYHLIQKKNTTEQLEYPLVEPSVISFVTGISVNKEGTPKTRKNKGEPSNKTKRVKKPNLIIQDEEDEEDEEQPQQAAPVQQPQVNNSPIYNNDGTITWNNPVYQVVWNSLSSKYKNALLQDHEWLEETIIQYVKDKEQRKNREFLNPTNLIIPPQILQDGKYDFGNPVYNNIFNNKIQKIQRDVLIGMISKTDNSNNSIFMETLGKIVGKELEFSPY